MKTRTPVLHEAGKIHPYSDSKPLTIADAEERTLQGSYLGSCIPARDVPAYITLYQPGRLPVEELVSHKLKLEDVKLALKD